MIATVDDSDSVAGGHETATKYSADRPMRWLLSKTRTQITYVNVLALRPALATECRHNTFQ
jgi:hypothetical protein